ncbi:hypothetical protein HOC13_03455 [Candidatus Woesearchaeota archaeon]|nr:hypothetical protein [Candidatus Woesearchaeota archaeon]
MNKKKKIKDEGKKRSYIEKYIPHVAEALRELLGLDEITKKKIEDNLGEILEHTRGELEEIKIDNPDYDPELAKIGSEKAELSGTLKDKKSLKSKEVKEIKKVQEKKEDIVENNVENNKEDDITTNGNKQTTLI